MEAKIEAMFIVARGCRLPLVEALEACDIDVVPVSSCSEARRVLQTRPEVQVVLTDTELPDGDWRKVLDMVAQARPSLQVIVCPRIGDDSLWIDVLDYGANDLLAQPDQCVEVRRILEGASARSYARPLPPSHATRRKTVARAAGDA
jgi:DNA-binding NtrC family response regulator